MQTSADIKKLWAKTSLYVWPENYWLVSLPVQNLSDALSVLGYSSKEFITLILEKDEISLSLSDRLLEIINSLPVDKKIAGPYKVITLNINLNLDICGYLLEAAKELAANGISIIPQCGYLKDHLVIKECDSEKAINVLNALIKKCQVN